MCLGYAVFFGNVVLMPLWLQSNLGYTATWAGLVSAPSGITAILASMMMGRLMHRFDPRVLAASSFAFFALSYFMRAQLTADSSYLVFVLPQLVQGLGMGTFFIAMLAVSFDRLPAHKVPSASRHEFRLARGLSINSIACLRAKHRIHLSSTGRASRPVAAAARRQCGGRRHRRRRRHDRVGTLQQRLGLRCLLHFMGWPSAAWPQCLRVRARRLDTGLFSSKIWRGGAAADTRLGLADGARRGSRLG